MFVVSINAGAQVIIILLACGPCVIIVNCWDRLCTLGGTPRTKETLPDFHEWCRVTRHPRIFRGLTGCQRTPGFWGVTFPLMIYSFNSFYIRLFCNLHLELSVCLCAFSIYICFFLLFFSKRLGVFLFRLVKY